MARNIRRNTTQKKFNPLAKISGLFKRKPKEESVPQRSYGKAHFRSNNSPRVERSSSRIKLPKINFTGIPKYFLYFGALVGVAASIGFITRQILYSSEFKIKNINVYGLVQIDEENIKQKLNEYKNKEYFQTTTTSIVNNIKQENVYLKDIFVEKIFPDTINVFIVERFPKIVLINLTGAYLIDQENVVVDLLSKTESLKLDDDTKRILQGFSNEENKLVEERIKNSLTEEEKETFDFSKVEKTKKTEAFKALEIELKAKAEQILDQNSKGTSTTEFANMNRVFVYSDKEYSIGQTIEKEITDLSYDVISLGRESESLTTNKLIWKDSFTLSLFTQEGKEIIFTPRREFWRQSADLKAVLDILSRDRQPYSVIDLTTSVVGVR